MSAKLCGLIWEIGPQERVPRYVLLAIADNASDNGHAYPGIDLISEKALVSERYAIQVIQKLKADGWLTVERKILNGKGNEYYVNVKKLENLKEEKRSHDKSSGEIHGKDLRSSGEIHSRTAQSSREIHGSSQVKSMAVSGEIHGNPPHPLLGEPSGTVIEPFATVGENAVAESGEVDFSDPAVWKEPTPPVPPVNGKDKEPAAQRRADLIRLCKYAWDDKNPGVQFIFDEKDGSAVKRFLRVYGKVDLEVVARWFDNALASADFNGSWRPHQYLDKLNSWGNGPHDKFKRLIDRTA